MKKHVPKLRPDQCPSLKAANVQLKCYNNDCGTSTPKDDLTILKKQYKYSMDVRGFEWNKNAKTFEGRLFLGMPN